MQSNLLIKSQRRWWDFVQPLLDAAALMASLGFVHWITARPLGDMSTAVGLIAVVVFLLVSQLTGLQRRQDAGNADREMADVVATWTITFLVLAVLALVARLGAHFSVAAILSWMILAPTLIGLERMLLTTILVRNHGISCAAKSRMLVGVPTQIFAGWSIWDARA